MCVVVVVCMCVLLFNLDIKQFRYLQYKHHYTLLLSCPGWILVKSTVVTVTRRKASEECSLRTSPNAHHPSIPGPIPQNKRVNPNLDAVSCLS